MREGGRRWIVTWLCALVLAGSEAGCSLLVEPEQGGMSCAVSKDGQDPCPEGLQCVQGRCEEEEDALPDAGADADAGDSADACLGDPDAAELCNGIDDNCRGGVDEGHDADDDEATWCGGGDPDKADCDDNAADSFPGNSEKCDGLDNDCDGEIDEEDDEEDDESLCGRGEECLEGSCVTPSCLFEGSSVTCPDGTRCDPSGECIEGEGCTEESCASGERCDRDSGTCVKQSKANGEPCATHDECASGSCILMAALNMVRDYARICGQSCCRDADCGENEFCFNGGRGARSCLPHSMDPRLGSPLEACSATADCEGESGCVVQPQALQGDGFQPRAALYGAVCGDAVGRAEPGAYCPAETWCTSNICESHYGALPLCTVPCGQTADCKDVFRSGPAACLYRSLAPEGLHALDYGGVCILGREGLEDLKSQGEGCGQSAECRDGACVHLGEGAFCADTCCNDAQCKGNTRCRPVARGGNYGMRCVP